MNAPHHDPRLDLLQHWLRDTVPTLALDASSLRPASSDASFRRYFRVARQGDARATVIVMDAPPDKEDCGPFIKVDALIRNAGVNAPEILHQDLDHGFLVLEDFGDTTYRKALHEENVGHARDLYEQAWNALAKIQAGVPAAHLPSYDAALLRREMDLFPDWFLARHHRMEVTDAKRATLDRIMALLTACALAQPVVAVHRDYHSRNLMVIGDNSPGVLDFQDAVAGPITYDLVSLFRDAYISWDEEVVLDWTIRYWEHARKKNLPVAADFADFWRDFEWMGLQRHLKVLGIFCRLNYRDNKPAYLQDLPRVASYARAVASRYASLAPLLGVLDEAEQRSPDIGYTF